jgi:hypothetical protein
MTKPLEVPLGFSKPSKPLSPCQNGPVVAVPLLGLLRHE